MITIDSPNSLDLCYRTQSNFNLNFYSSGIIKRTRNWAHRERTIDCYELMVVFEGELHISENNRRHDLCENDVLLMSPHTTLGSFEVSTNKTSFGWVRFSSDHLDKFNISPGKIQIDDINKIKNLLNQINTISHIPDYPKYFPELLTCVMLSEIGIAQKHADSNNLAFQIAKWISENPTVKIEDISSNFGYNKDYLGRIFKRAYNITIKDYSTKALLDNAKALLITSNYPIKKIASILDFTNENLFVKFFKYHEKISPKEYRNSQRK